MKWDQFEQILFDSKRLNPMDDVLNVIFPGRLYFLVDSRRDKKQSIILFDYSSIDTDFPNKFAHKT